jgi:beta-galactosidase
VLPVIGELRPWTDPEVVSIGRLPMRPPSTAFPDLASARAGDRAASPWWRALDGRWRFRLHDHPDRVTPGDVRGDASGGGWTTVAVPGNWTLQGVGDLPHYTNVEMPFPGPPPALPTRNPTGVHRRSFTVPARWRGRRIVVHVGGAESVHAVFVNGRFVGYGTDSRLASEYDVTEHVDVGRNELAIVVVRYSAQSYVEDQDQWWMAGLHREVFVEARAATHVHALVCTADLRPDGTGVADVRVILGGDPPGPGWRVRTWVETLGGSRLAPIGGGDVPHRFAQAYLFNGHQVVARFEVPRARPWTPETPDRVRVVAELVDPSGATVEVHARRVGFRRVEIAGGELRVNGRRITIHGVNRHDHHPDRGKAVTVDDMRDDLLAMRRLNITAVRCSHYPNDPRFLDLCDELGMYVVDEANIESHAYNTSLCHDPRYRSTWLARGSRMVERDVDHPSVIMWSLGNESGFGAHHDALAGWIRRADPSRPLHDEGAVFHAGWDDGGRAVTDVVCPMYPTIDAIAGYRGDRPLVMCEYSHAMGNSNGSLADYWDAIAANRRL